MKFTDLSPFVSLVVTESIPATTNASTQISDVLQDVVEQLQHRDNLADFDSTGPELGYDNFELGRITYLETSQPGWAPTGEFTDTEHHLFLMCCRGNKAAFFVSDPTLLRYLNRALDEFDTGPWAGLSKIPRLRLNAAFVRNKTVTLWLSGLHRQADTKVNNKVITGTDLRYALDPLGDQTFTFTAARSRLNLGRTAERSIGVAPRKSTVWAGPSLGWTDFLDQVRGILDTIPAKHGDPSPLPCLAADVDPAAELPAVNGAFDVSFASVEAFDNNLTTAQRLKLERWADAKVQVTKVNRSNLAANLWWPTSHGRRENVGRLSIAVAVKEGSLIVTPTLTARAHADAEAVHSAQEMIGELHIWEELPKIWFGSGHVLTGHVLHKLQFREFPFEGFEWVDFNTYDVSKEKPAPLATAQIGRQDSLFCWVFNEWKPDGKKRWRGWLVCTDGAMEMADFIHLSEGGGVPTVTLIHAKGADSARPDRGLSVSAYEIVVSQAVKNLRHLDPEIMLGRFYDQIDARIGDAVWHNGRLTAKAAMRDAIRKAGANFKRKVIILQPHVRRSVLLADDPKGGRRDTRAAQLHTLLLAAQANCQALGAEMSVIADSR